MCGAAARESDEAMARRLQAELNDELAGRRSRLHRTKPQPETQVQLSSPAPTATGAKDCLVCALKS